VPNPVPTDPTAERVAALERQVAELTARLAPEPEDRYDRRTLLRRGGAVLAGVAGAVALPSAAGAAEGDPLLLGQVNDAGSATTALTGGSAGAAALQVANPTAAGAYVAPAVRVVPGVGTEGLDPARTAAGDLASSGDLLWYGHVSATGGAGVAGAVYTSAFANHLEFLTEPRRVLDTRPGESTDEAGNPNDRATRVVAGQRDGSGRVAAGTSLVLDLSGLVRDGAGVFANLTVVSPAASGFLTAYPTPDGSARTDGRDRPAASNLNFVRGTPALANFALVRLGSGGRISIFTTTLAHILLDVTAVSVSQPFSLVQSPTAGGALRIRP
jgi:hypothetical protein